MLARHSWPGNVRELRNVIQRAALMTEGNLIEPKPKRRKEKTSRGQSVKFNFWLSPGHDEERGTWFLGTSPPVFLTLVVWVYMYIRRISFITSRNLSPQDLTDPGELARLSPPAVSNPSDNLKNLFEMPVIFYTLALYLFVTNQVDALYVGTAWVFVAFRTLHSAVHCTINIVLLRF